MSEERRHQARLPLTMPVKVTGFEPDRKTWTEMSSVKDASPSGASFLLKHPVIHGHVLHLSLPLPKRFRSYDLGEATYQVYALVRTVSPESPGARVGVMFLGKQPPRGFDQEPAMVYLLPNDPPPAKRGERRRFERITAFVDVHLTRLAGSSGPSDERTIAENIGRGGARVMSTLGVGAGEVLLFSEIGGDFETRASVRGAYVGPDSIPRLNLQFLDGEAPDRLVAAR